MPRDLKPCASEDLPEDNKGYWHKPVFATEFVKYAFRNSLILPQLCYIHRNVILVSEAVSPFLSRPPSRCFINISTPTITLPILSLKYVYFLRISVFKAVDNLEIKLKKNLKETLKTLLYTLGS